MPDEPSPSCGSVPPSSDACIEYLATQTTPANTDEKIIITSESDGGVVSPHPLPCRRCRVVEDNIVVILLLEY